MREIGLIGSPGSVVKAARDRRRLRPVAAHASPRGWLSGVDPGGYQLEPKLPVSLRETQLQESITATVCALAQSSQHLGLELPVAASASVSLSRRLALMSLTERHYQKGPIGAPGSHQGPTTVTLLPLSGRRPALTTRLSERPICMCVFALMHLPDLPTALLSRATALAAGRSSSGL
jgi:hypothetical protein